MAKASLWQRIKKKVKEWVSGGNNNSGSTKSTKATPPAPRTVATNRDARNQTVSSSINKRAFISSLKDTQKEQKEENRVANAFKATDTSKSYKDLTAALKSDVPDPKQAAAQQAKARADKARKERSERHRENLAQIKSDWDANKERRQEKHAAYHEATHHRYDVAEEGISKEERERRKQNIRTATLGEMMGGRDDEALDVMKVKMKYDKKRTSLERGVANTATAGIVRLGEKRLNKGERKEAEEYYQRNKSRGAETVGSLVGGMALYGGTAGTFEGLGQKAVGRAAATQVGKKLGAEKLAQVMAGEGAKAALARSLVGDAIQDSTIGAFDTTMDVLSRDDLKTAGDYAKAFAGGQALNYGMGLAGNAVGHGLPVAGRAARDAWGNFVDESRKLRVVPKSTMDFMDDFVNDVGDGTRRNLVMNGGTTRASRLQGLEHEVGLKPKKLTPKAGRASKSVDEVFDDAAVKALKERQLKIINESNPKDPTRNASATWVESTKDIQTWEEAMRDDYYGGGDVTPDFTWADAQKAAQDGYITVYSSKPIEQGGFVTPSRMLAESYGNANPYSQRVKLTDVAWIDMSEGQLAKEAGNVAAQTAEVHKTPSDVLQGYSSKGSKKKISDAQKRAKKLIANGDVDGARREVESAVDDILRSTKTVAPLDDTTEEIKEFLKNTKISVSDKAKVDAGYESGGYGEFRKQNFGSLKLTKDGTPVDDLWLFLQEQYGTGIFPDEITHPTEQLHFLSELAKSKGKEFELEGDELSFVKDELTNSIWDSVNKQEVPQKGTKTAAQGLDEADKVKTETAEAEVKAEKAEAKVEETNTKAKGAKPAAKKLEAKKGKGKKTTEKPIDHDAAKRFRKNRSKKYKELKERYKAIDEIYDADKKGEWVFYKDKSGELCVGDPSREHGSHGMYDKNGDYFGKLTQENFDRAKKAFDDGNLNPTVPRGKTKVETPEPKSKSDVDPLKTYKEKVAKQRAEAKSKEVAAQKVVEPESKVEAEAEPPKPPKKAKSQAGNKLYTFEVQGKSGKRIVEVEAKNKSEARQLATSEEGDKSAMLIGEKEIEPKVEPKTEPKTDAERPETSVVAKGEAADAGESAKSGERTEFRRSEEPSAKEQARNRRADTNREKATQESFDKDYAAFEKKIGEVDKLRGRIRVAQGAEKEALQKQLDALKAEVERDYRKASLRYHPDRGGSNEWFSAFNKARDDFRKGNVRQGAGFRDAWSSTRKGSADAGGGNTPPPRNGAGGNGGNTPPPKGERFADYDGLRRPKGYAKRTQRAMHSVEDMVGATKTKKTWRETLRQFRDEADRKFVDSLKDFEQVARERKKTLGKDAMEKLYGAINKARSYRARATTSVSSHQLKADGTRYKVKGEDGVMRDAPSIAEIFSGMDKETEKSFNAYLLLNHNIDRLREGKPIFKDTVLYDWDELSKRFGMSKSEIGERLGVNAGADIDLNDADVCKNFAELYETRFSDFKNRAAQVRQYTANELNNRVEAGLLSRETMDKWLHDHPNYVPTYREGLFDGVGAVRNGAVGASDLRAAKGSDLNIYDIKEQLADATVRNWRDISLNNLLEKTFGDNIKGLAESAEVSPYIYALDHTMNVGKSADGGKFYADVYRNGKAERIEIDKRFYDDLKDLYKNGRMGNGLDGLNDKVLVPLASLWKNLITEWSPIFMVKNFMRDYPEAIINSRNRKEFLSITADGSALKDLLSEGEYTQALRDAGISASTFIDINKAVKDFDNGKGGLKTLLPKLNAGVEMYPRLVEFMATIRKAGYTKLSDIPANEYTELIDKAAANAADVTVNFGRSGSVGKLLNKGAIPFLNPSIQGWSKFARNITELDGMKDTLGFLLSATALGAAPMVATNLLYHNNPNYQQISARDKANNYIIALPPTSTTTDKFLKIPRSRFASVYGLPLVNVANENKMGWGTAFQVVNDQVAPLNPIESHFGANLIQAARNQTWYGTPIESESMKTLPANERYDATTSNISIGAAQGLNKITKGKVKISPKKLDYVLDANFGVVADFALPMTTKSKKDGNVLKQFGNVGKRAFTIDSAVQNDLSTRYYDKATVLEQSKNSRDATDADKKAYDKFNSWDSRIKGVTNAMRYVQNSDSPNKQEAYRELAKLRNENMQKALDGKRSINNTRDIDIIHKYAGTSYTIENLGKSADQNALKAYSAAVYGNLSEDEMRKKIDSDTEFYKGYKGIAKTQNALQKIDPNLKGGNALTYAVGLADAGANDDVFASYGTTLQSRTESASKAQRAKDYLKNNGSVEEFAQLENAVKNLGKLSDVDKDKLEDEAYAKLQSGKMSIDEYNTELKKIDYNANQSYVGKAVSLAMSGAPARAYNLYDIKGKNVQKGYNLAAMGIDSRKYRELSQACDKDGNGYLKTAEIRDFVANSDYEDKATLFDALCYYSNVRNPFGSPTNYSSMQAAEMGKRNGVTQINVNAGADNTVFNEGKESSSGYSGYGGYGGRRWRRYGGGGSRGVKVSALPKSNYKASKQTYKDIAATLRTGGTTTTSTASKVKIEPPKVKFKEYEV